MRTLKVTAITFLASIVAGGLGGPIVGWLVSQRTSQPTAFSVSGFLPAVPSFACWVALAILPVCLLIVAHIVRFLPPRSFLAHPITATGVGAFVGAFSIYFWDLITVVRRPYVPDFAADANPMFYSLALVVGAIGGLVCSLFGRANVA